MIDYQYITSPLNYKGNNPRNDFGGYTKGVYTPTLIDWLRGFSIEVSNDGSNNNFVSRDADGSILYQGVLANGFNLSTENVDVSITNGNVYFTLKSNSVHTITNTAPVKCFCKATENSRVRAFCSGRGKFQLLVQDNAMLIAEFDGGSDTIIDSSQPGSFHAKDSAFMDLTLKGSFEATSASIINATGDAVVNVLMQDSASLYGGKNEGGAVEGYQNATINIDMRDSSQIIRTGSNLSYFAFNLSNSTFCRLNMSGNAYIKCGNTNAYAINMWGTDINFDLLMQDNAKIEINTAVSNGRAITAKGGHFNITMKGDSIITCNGNGSTSCYAVGGNADSNFKIMLMDNAVLTNGMSSGKGGNRNDLIAGFNNQTNSHIEVWDNRALSSGKELGHTVTNTSCSVTIKGSGKANTAIIASSYDIVVDASSVRVNGEKVGSSYTNTDLSINTTSGVSITTNNVSKVFTITDNAKKASSFTFNGGNVELTSSSPSAFKIATANSANVTANVSGGNQGSGEYVKTSGSSVLNLTLSNFTHSGNDSIKSEGSSNLTLNLTGTTNFTNGGYGTSSGDIVNKGYIYAVGSSTLTLNMHDRSFIGEHSVNGVIVGCLINDSANATLNVNMYDDAQIEAQTTQTQALVSAISNVSTGRVNITMSGNSHIFSPSTCRPLVKDIIYNNGTMVCTLNDNAIIESTSGGTIRICNFRNEDTLTINLNGTSQLINPLDSTQGWTRNTAHISTTYRNTIRDNRTAPKITCVGRESNYDNYVSVNYSGANKDTYLVVK